MQRCISLRAGKALCKHLRSQQMNTGQLEGHGCGPGSMSQHIQCTTNGCADGQIPQQQSVSRDILIELTSIKRTKMLQVLHWQQHKSDLCAEISAFVESEHMIVPTCSWTRMD